MEVDDEGCLPPHLTLSPPKRQLKSLPYNYDRLDTLSTQHGPRDRRCCQNRLDVLRIPQVRHVYIPCMSPAIHCYIVGLRETLSLEPNPWTHVPIRKMR